MSGTRYGISTTAITWEQTESEIEQDSTGKTVISVAGVVGVSGSPTALDEALALLPTSIPISDNGPIGNASAYNGAKISTRGAKYDGDDTIMVRATYEISTAISFESPDGVDDSENDRAQRTIVTEDAPILTHPVSQEFDPEERRKLCSLLDGTVRVNPTYKPSGTGKQLYEFIRDKDEDEGEGVVEVTFSSSNSTVGGITANPLDYARAIAAGATTWRRPVIRHTITKSRNAPAPNAEYSKVGEVVSGTPSLAPNVSGDFQWFLNGITDSTDNGENWVTNYEYELTGEGGALRIFYKNGTAELL